MKLKLRFFAFLRESLGLSELDIECPEGTTVDVLRHDLGVRYGASSSFGTRMFVAVNWDPAEAKHELREGDEVAFLPPMSGGSSREGSFWISETPISGALVEEKVRAAGCGGIVTFVGAVRDVSGGKRVLRLEYEAYPEMAERKMREIGEEVAVRWPGARVAMVHRVGRLEIGDVAVAIAVATPHRAAAFEACRHAIDRMKETVPIWKKEFTEEGEYWVDSRA